jgi:hypothetical protein
MKLLIFLAESKLLDSVYPVLDDPIVREYVTACNGGKCTFPALELEEGRVMLETNDIINYLAEQNGIDPSSMWLTQHYEQGVMSSFKIVFHHLIETKGGYPSALEYIKEKQGAEPVVVPEGTARAILAPAASTA